MAGLRTLRHLEYQGGQEPADRLLRDVTKIEIVI